MPDPLRTSFLREIDLDLHDLCQPLTALQCRLEMARMVGTSDAFRSAVEGGLEETLRIFQAAAHMRERLLMQRVGDR